MTREELKAHCERQIQQFEQIEEIMPVTLNDWKRYEEHKLILELLEQEPRKGHWITLKDEWGDINEAVCSCCDSNGHHKWHYCSNCGARMVESQESEG